MRDYTEIEHSQMQTNLKRVELAVESVQKQLLATTKDWAWWDDTHKFMIDKNEEFRESWFTLDSFKALNITHAAFFDLEQNVDFGVLVDFENETVTELSDKSEVTPSVIKEKFIKFSTSKEPTYGLVEIEGKILLVASAPIMDTARSKPSNGVLVLAMTAGEAFIRMLADQTQLNLVTIDLTKGAVALTDSEYIDKLKGGQNQIVKIVSDNAISGYSLLRDIEQKPLLVIRNDSSRPIYERSGKTRNNLIFLVLVCLCVMLVTTLFVLNRAVFRPLERISGQATKVADLKDLTIRVDAKGKDELGKVGGNINKMLVAIQQLQDESSRAKAAAEFANRAKSDFIAKVSHELRTPIGSILGLLRLVRKSVTDETARSQMGMIRAAASGLLGIVNDILDFSKSEVGELPVNPEPMNLKASVRTALRTVASRLFERAEGQPIECIGTIDPSVPEEIVGDSKRISQVLINLVSNAIKFTSKGSIVVAVNLSTSSDGTEQLVFSVKDTGIGIPKDKLDSIFRPFTQVDNSMQRQYQGTGLGLTIVDQLVRAMGGSVTVESEVNVGSTFTVRFPLVRTVAQNPFKDKILNHRSVWVLNNFETETEESAKAFAMEGYDVGIHTTEDLKKWDIDTIDIGKIGVLVVGGNTLTTHRAWKLLTKMAEKHGPKAIVVSLSPHELAHREQLRSIGITQITLTPMLAQDLTDIIKGTHKENFIGYDDIIDTIEPSSVKLNVLLADDLLSNQILLAAMLKDAGHSVTVVGNGKQMLDALGHTVGMREKREGDVTFDIVLSDVQMPVMDGLTAIRIFREQESRLGIDHQNRLPILAITAHAFSEEQQRMIEAGADGTVTKPILPAALRDVIEKTLVDKGKLPLPEATPAAASVSKAAGLETVNELLEFITKRGKEAEAEIRKVVRSETEIIICDTERIAGHARGDLTQCLIIIDAYQKDIDQLQGEVETSMTSTEVNLETLGHGAHGLKNIFAGIGCEVATKLALNTLEYCRAGKRDAAVREAQMLLKFVGITKSIFGEAIQRAEPA